MGRPSNREERRSEIVAAFAQVLAESGFAGATIAQVAAKAGYAPGLLHHHFAVKDELLDALLSTLVAAFRARVRGYESAESRLLAYVDGALKLDAQADVTAARCWVGVFAEALRNPGLFARVRRLLDAEIGSI
jgi:TetR/AcrR family transcriptional repressor of bet genes